MRAAITCVLLVAGEAHAGPSYYGWLPATDIARDDGTQVESWIAEENDVGHAHLRETAIGAAPVFASGDRFELAIPFEFARVTEDGVDPSFTLRSFALEGRWRFADRAAAIAPFVKARVERDVIVRDLVRVRLDPAIAVARRGVHVVADVGVVADANRGDFHLAVQPGIGASFCVARGLRAGAELHVEKSLDAAANTWAAAGPNLAWIRTRSWLVLTVGIGLYNIQTAPRLVWGIAL